MLQSALLRHRLSRGLQLLLCELSPPILEGEWTPAMNGLAPECEEDKKRLCSNIKPGGGRTHQCILDNKEKLSEKCRRAEFTADTAEVYKQVAKKRRRRRRRRRLRSVGWPAALAG